ncbi:uncharacterized protein LOC143769194 [Ranitomeya variabilis]|uniref:uncharacterized protein LOC143769194 n=1 Tax=Ranitomeya variabilis TaxID=490064 RepID=UPI0040572F4E
MGASVKSKIPNQTLHPHHNVNGDVVIKPADKGGNIVVWPTKLYLTEAYRLLRDSKCYKKLTYNPLISFRDELDKILQKALSDGVITVQVRDVLLGKDHCIPTLYLLPKVHKHLHTPPDVLVERGEDGLLLTSVFRKETAVNAVLHASSSHPPHVIDAVPTGRFLRLKRICATNEMFETQAADLKNRFMDRGYSRRSIKRAYNRAKHSNRHHLLYSPKQIKHTNQVRPVLAFLTYLYKGIYLFGIGMGTYLFGSDQCGTSSSYQHLSHIVYFIIVTLHISVIYFLHIAIFCSYSEFFFSCVCYCTS